MQTRSQSKLSISNYVKSTSSSPPSSPITRSQIKNGNYSNTRSQWTSDNIHLLPGITTRSGLILHS